MNCRRITGGVLAAFLLLTIALPAVCQECFNLAAETGCADRHNTAVAERTHSGMSMDATCASCGDQHTVAAKESGTHRIAPDFLILHRGPHGCSEVIIQGATIGLGEGSGANQYHASRVIVDASPGADLVLEINFRNFSPSVKTSSKHSAYEPLAVSLKI